MLGGIVMSETFIISLWIVTFILTIIATPEYDAKKVREL